MMHNFHPISLFCYNRNNWISLVFIAALSLVFSQSANALEIQLAADSKYKSLYGAFEKLVDPAAELTITDIMSGNHEGEFQAHPGFKPGGYSKEAHWYRFTVKNQSDTPGKWLLNIGAPYLNELDIYIDHGDRVEHSILGDHRPTSGRKYKTRDFTVSLTLTSDKQATVYARVASNSVLAFYGAVWEPDTFFNREITHNWYFGTYYGVMGFVLFFNILFGVWLRDRGLQAYGGYVFTLILLHLGLNGFSAIIFPNMPGWFYDVIVGVGVIGGAVTNMIMWAYFLSLKETFPRLNRLYLISAGILSLGLLSVTTHYYSWVTAPIGYIGSVFVLLSLGVILYLAFRKRANITHLFYFAAFLFVLLGVATRMMAVTGIIPLTDFTYNFYQTSSVFHIVFLSLGAVYRFKNMQKDKDIAERKAILTEERAQDQRRFIAFLSHELRSPLASIDKAAQMVQLESDKLSDKAHERVGRIRARSTQMYNQVEQFLAAEVLDQGEFALKREHVDADSLMQEVMDTLPTALNSDRVSCVIQPVEFPLNVDIELFKTAMMNVIKNALVYSADDSQVKVNFSRQKENCLIKITDQGLGMDKDELGKVGEVYFRAKSSKGTKGTGLGLHLAQKIVSAHAGKLSVKSEANKGTVISIEIPAH